MSKEGGNPLLGLISESSRLYRMALCFWLAISRDQRPSAMTQWVCMLSSEGLGGKARGGKARRVKAKQGKAR